MKRIEEGTLVRITGNGTEGHHFEKDEVVTVLGLGAQWHLGSVLIVSYFVVSTDKIQLAQLVHRGHFRPV